VKKASLGAELAVSMSYHRNSLILADEFHTAGCRLIALESTPESTLLFNFSLPDDLQHEIILIIGNEISGIDPQLLAMADNLLHLPMSGSKTSLNVAVATGIALYYLGYQISN